ncbi:MAG: response regulator transcription factor [Hyphomicrobiaceae bacterium]|nr:response regulator transcription factor [Hyphomicrobiaceae bacterium]
MREARDCGRGEPLLRESDAAAIARLTARQRRVFGLLGDGLSNKEIARMLSLHESTVKVHVSAILAKLECRNRTAAALLSLRNRLHCGSAFPERHKLPTALV